MSNEQLEDQVVQLDLHTFGGSRAAEILVKNLREINDPKLAKRVGAFLDHVLSGFAALSPIDDDHWFARFVRMWRNAKIAEVEARGFHSRVDSFVRSVIVGASRDWIRGDR